MIRIYTMTRWLIETVIAGLSLLCLLFLSFKFVKMKDHFVISQRMPVLSLVVAITVIVFLFLMCVRGLLLVAESCVISASADKAFELVGKWTGYTISASLIARVHMINRAAEVCIHRYWYWLQL